MHTSKTKNIFNIPSEWFNSINKIRNKLLFVLLFVTLLPTLVIGGYALLFTTDTLHKNSLSIHSAKIDLISEKIQNYLAQVNSDLFYLRDSNALNLYLSSIESKSAHKKRLMLTNLRTSFMKFASQKKNYQQIYFISSEGKAVVGIDYEGYQAHIISDEVLQNQKNSAYFQNAMALNKDDLSVTVLDLNQNDSIIVKQNQFTINYSTPVYDESNKLLGIIALNVDMKIIMDIITGETQAGTRLEFVNPDGFYYVYSEDGTDQKNDNSLNSKINLFSNKPELRELIQNTSVAESFSFDNDIVTYKAIKVNDNKILLGIILDFTPENLVFETEYNFLYLFISVILLALVITFILAIILSNSITQPLIALTDDVDKLSRGDLEKPIVLESADEIGKLAIAIERLRKSLKILMRRAA
jgi:HAMP domain-containing protein